MLTDAVDNAEEIGVYIIDSMHFSSLPRPLLPHVSSRAPSPRKNHRHIRFCLSPLRLALCPSHPPPPRFAPFVTLPTSPYTMPSEPVAIFLSALTSNSVHSPSCVHPTSSTQTRASVAMPISPKSLARNKQRQSGKLHSIWPNGLA